MITITLADVVTKGKQALQNKKLGFHSEFNTECAYYYPDNCRCIVGWAMPEEFAIENVNAGTVVGLRSQGLVRFNGDEELDQIYLLQRTHDSLCEFVRDNDLTVEEAELRMAEALEQVG